VEGPFVAVDPVMMACARHILASSMRTILVRGRMIETRPKQCARKL
jgi:hypothetical protein